MANPAYSPDQLSMLPQTSENLFVTSVTIPAGDSVSGGIPTQGRVIVSIFVPPVWTPAGIAYQGSVDGFNWSDLAVDSGGNIIQSAATINDLIAFPQVDAIKVPFIRLVSVAAAGGGAAVNQVAAATLMLCLSRLFGGS